MDTMKNTKVDSLIVLLLNDQINARDKFLFFIAQKILQTNNDIPGSVGASRKQPSYEPIGLQIVFWRLHALIN